jgi:hypothetical protein
MANRPGAFGDGQGFLADVFESSLLGELYKFLRVYVLFIELFFLVYEFLFHHAFENVETALLAVTTFRKFSNKS